MKTTDTTEKGLESLIVWALTGGAHAQSSEKAFPHEGGAPYGGVGYVQGDPKSYVREHAVDLGKLLDFLEATQPKVVEQVGLAGDGPQRRKFLARLQGEIAKRGVIDVLRNGIKHGPAPVDVRWNPKWIC